MTGLAAHDNDRIPGQPVLHAPYVSVPTVFVTVKQH